MKSLNWKKISVKLPKCTFVLNYHIACREFRLYFQQQIAMQERRIHLIFLCVNFVHTHVDRIACTFVPVCSISISYHTIIFLLSLEISLENLWSNSNEIFRLYNSAQLIPHWRITSGVIWYTCMENVEFGNLIPGKFCYWREIFAILRENWSFRWIFQSFSFKNSWKLVKLHILHFPRLGDK